MSIGDPLEIQREKRTRERQRVKDDMPVAALISGGGGGAATEAADSWAVGDEKRAYRTDDHVVDSYYTWKFLDGRTIGDASSGATWANADAEALFLFLYDNTIDAWCKVYTSAGVETTRAAQGSAATAWAAHCRLAIPDARGDAYGPRYLTGAGGDGPAVAAIGGDATLQPGLTVAADLAGIETDTGTANIYINDNMSIPYPTPETTAGYVGVEDTGHKHPVTDIASALSGSTTAEFNVHPRYLAAGVFILAKVG